MPKPAVKKGQIPSWVRDALQKRGISDARIASMDSREMFEEYCQWHGLIGWSGQLYDTVVRLREFEADKSR